MTLAPVLDAMTATWSALRDDPERVQRDLHIAGQDVRVVVVGHRLAEIAFTALAAHRAASGPPSAEIGAWDAEATGVTLPSVPASVTPGLRWTATRDGEVIVEVALLEDGSIRAADRDAHRYLLGIPSVPALSSWERGAPLRRQLLWALWPAAQLVHAAGVATDDGVALLAGRSGAGKTSTALACALAGMAFLGDDHCAVTPGAPPTVHHLHASARVLTEELVHVPAAHRGSSPVDEDKVLVWPGAAGSTVLPQGPLRVVLLLERGAASTPELIEVRPSTALRLIAPSMLLQQHIAPDLELAGLRALLGAVPVHSLRLGTDRAANPPVIASAIAAAGTG